MSLTPREHQVLAAYCRLGMYKLVADELAISPRTVRNHLRSVHRKYGTWSTVRVIVIALAAGELRMDEIAA